MNPGTPNSSTEAVPTVEPWVMPEWMEPYRDSFTNTGGNTVEELMADLNNKNLMRTNIVLFTLASCVSSQVGMLERLHRDGALREVSQ